jgi:tetratricopeptide (TPR) repeat protein
VDTAVALNHTQTYLNSVYKAANQYFDGAYSYEEAYRYFKEFLRFEPNHLDSILNGLLALFRTSTLKKNVFKEIVDTFSNSEIILEQQTYIRIGHFFEELMASTFLYQRRLIDFIEGATPSECEIALNNLVDLLSFYNFINENINLFTEEEYKDSIFISKEELSLNKEKLLTYMRGSNRLNFDVNNLGSAEIFVNNRKIIHSEFDVETYTEVNDFAFFDVMKNGLKANYRTFALLILFTIGVVAGLILGFTLSKEIQWIGWVILAVFAAADVITYVVFTKKREKKLAQLNK